MPSGDCNVDGNVSFFRFGEDLAQFRCPLCVWVPLNIRALWKSGDSPTKVMSSGNGNFESSLNGQQRASRTINMPHEGLSAIEICPSRTNRPYCGSERINTCDPGL